jgi:hypothetical protein
MNYLHGFKCCVLAIGNASPLGRFPYTEEDIEINDRAGDSATPPMPSALLRFNEDTLIVTRGAARAKK